MAEVSAEVVSFRPTQEIERHEVRGVAAEAESVEKRIVLRFERLVAAVARGIRRVKSAGEARLRDSKERRRHATEATITSSQQTGNAVFDLSGRAHSVIEQYPWQIVVASVGVGYLCGAVLRRRQK